MKGPNAYGWLKTETGIHRLVRQSPFNASLKRQTSFASVSVYVAVDDSTNTITIKPSDLKIETMKASGTLNKRLQVNILGCGGQSVNTTDSAVRITHIPTKIVVQVMKSIFLVYTISVKMKDHNMQIKKWQ